MGDRQDGMSDQRRSVDAVVEVKGGRTVVGLSEILNPVDDKVATASGDDHRQHRQQHPAASGDREMMATTPKTTATMDFSPTESAAAEAAAEVSSNHDVTMMMSEEGGSRPPVVATIPLFPIPDHVGMEVDSAPSGSDTDSTMGGEMMSSTMSLRESVYAFLEENGRTYHAFNAGKYNLPNDEAEQERLDLQHHLFLLTLDGQLHVAPLPPALHNVLDIGTGTGIWATEFAEQYPMARVIGTDLSPIQPLYVPPNCSFEVNDAEESWDYSQKFDYVHGRALLSCFRDPTFIIASAFASLRPGGILELQDPQMPALAIDSSMQGSSLETWSRVVPEGAANLGRVVTNSRFYPQWMREAGFVDVVEKHYYWPLNTWPRGKREKMIGMWAQQNVLDGVEAMSMAILTRGLGWSKEMVEMLLVGVRNDLRDRNIHAYIDVIVCYGRKPEPHHGSPSASAYASGGE